MHNMIYIYMYNMQIMQNMQTWTPMSFVLLQHRNKGTRVLFHPGICLGFNREQQKQCAESDIINSELKSAFGNSRRANEHPVLLHFLWCHRPTGNAHLTMMFYMPNQEGCIQANVPPCGVSADAVCPRVTCSVNQVINMQNMLNIKKKICKIG